MVTNAAREGARAAAVQSDNATIDAKLYGSFCSGYPSTSNCAIDASKVSVTKTNVQGTRGSETSVRVAFNFQYVTPIGDIMALVGGSSISAPTIASTSFMRLE